MWNDILKSKKKPKIGKTKSTAFRGQQITQEFDVNFIKSFKTWKTKCESAKAGTPKTGTTGATQENLFQFVKNHVVADVMRKNSPNQDGQGATNIINRLDAITTQQEVATEKDIKNIKNFARLLAKVKEDVNLNPANIPFTTPEDIVGGRAKYPKEPNTFGHYRTPLYNKLAGIKGQQKIRVPSSYYSTSRDFNARPPMYQALFGDGTVVKVGLLEVLEKGALALDEAKGGIDIQVIRKPGALAEIPEVKGVLKNLLKNTANNDNNTGELNLNNMARMFSSHRFTIGTSTEEKYVEEAAGLTGDNQVAGDLVSFRVSISGAVLGKLLVAVFGNKLGSMKSAGGFYIHGGPLDYRKRINGKPINHPNEAKDVKKSWMGALWNGN